MGLLDGTNSGWSDDEIRHVANSPVSWLGTAQGLCIAADTIDNLIRPKVEAHNTSQMMLTYLELQAVAPMIGPMNLLYAFAIENTFKSMIVHDDLDYDYLSAECQKQILGHNLRNLSTKTKFFSELDPVTLKLLDELTHIIKAQGRYPVAIRPNENVTINYIPHLRSIVADMIATAGNVLEKSAMQDRTTSPLGVVVKIIGDPQQTEYIKIGLEKAGINYFKN